MIGTIDVEIMAANPSMPLFPVRAFKNSPSNIRLRNVPKRIGNWSITSVQLVAIYPDNSINSVNCVLVGGVWVGTIRGCDIAGKIENGFTVFANGIDENGESIEGYVLGKGQIVILDADGKLPPDAPSYYVHLLSAEPSSPNEGDLWPTTDGYAIWQNGEAHNFSMTSSDVVEIVTAEKEIGVGDNWQNYINSSIKPQWNPEENVWYLDEGINLLEVSAPEDAISLEFQGYYTTIALSIQLYVDGAKHFDSSSLFTFVMADGTTFETYNGVFNYDGGEYTPVGDQSTWEIGNYYSFTVAGSIKMYFERNSKTVNAIGLATYDELQMKQNALNTLQLSAVNSGITSNKVSTYDGYTSQITTAQDTATAANTLATTISGLVPVQASTSNQLADKAFVNSSVQTATSNFRGNWETWANVPSVSSDYPEDYAGSKVPTINDYLVVQDASDLSSIYEGTWRFKYSGTWSTDGKNGWLPEYQVNETPMTAAQLAAINSNITSAKVAQYDAALANANYALHTATMPAPYIPSNMYPITYEASDMTFTINESDWGSSLNVSDVGGDYVLTHHNSTFDVNINLCYITYSGKYGGDIDVNTPQFNGVTPTTGVTQVLTIAAGYELEDRAVNTLTVDPLHYTCPLVFPTLIPNHARDFIVRIYAYAGDYTPTLSASGVTLMNAEGEMPEIKIDASNPCTTLIYFSEIASNIFLVKGEALEAITL